LVGKSLVKPFVKPLVKTPVGKSPAEKPDEEDDADAAAGMTAFPMLTHLPAIGPGLVVLRNAAVLDQSVISIGPWFVDNPDALQWGGSAGVTPAGCI
jgi:hypothetical protein